MKQHAPRGNKDPKKRAEREAAKRAPAPPSRPVNTVARLYRPAFTPNPSDIAIVRYAHSLVDPFDAVDVGIPFGAPLPTFKQTLYRSGTFSSGTALVVAAVEAEAAAKTHVGCKILHDASQLRFFTSTGNTATVTLATVACPSSRLVSAGIRISYAGRADEFGGTSDMYLRTADGATRTTRAAPRDAVARYHPQTNFDLEFKDSGTTNLTFESGISLVAYPPSNTSTYVYQIVATFETNSETPVTPVFTDGAYLTLHHSLTPQASGKVLDSLQPITSLVKKAGDTKKEQHHDEAHPSHSKSHGERLLRVAKDLEGGAVVAAGVATSLNGAYQAARVVGAMMPYAAAVL